MIFVGIDPGKQGGIGVVDDTGGYVYACRLPEDDRVLTDRLRGIMQLSPGIVITLERVRSSPQMGVVSAFTFGRGYGTIRGVLAGLGATYTEVTPQAWQIALGCRTKGDKNVTKAEAARLWSGVRMTHAIADALLIAEYGRLQHAC